MTTENLENDKLYQAIHDVLEEWKDTQFNISSESARTLLALAIHEKAHKHVSELIEDIVCPSDQWTL